MSAALPALAPLFPDFFAAQARQAMLSAGDAPLGAFITLRDAHGAPLADVPVFVSTGRQLFAELRQPPADWLQVLQPAYERAARLELMLDFGIVAPSVVIAVNLSGQAGEGAGGPELEGLAEVEA